MTNPSVVLNRSENPVDVVSMMENVAKAESPVPVEDHDNEVPEWLQDLLPKKPQPTRQTLMQQRGQMSPVLPVQHSQAWGWPQYVDVQRPHWQGNAGGGMPLPSTHGPAQAYAPLTS